MSKLDLINGGKQTLQLVHPDRPKLDSWGNHARDEPVEEIEEYLGPLSGFW
jgi:hypothetical protein